MIGLNDDRVAGPGLLQPRPSRGARQPVHLTTHAGSPCTARTCAASARSSSSADSASASARGRAAARARAAADERSSDAVDTDVPARVSTSSARGVRIGPEGDGVSHGHRRKLLARPGRIRAAAPGRSPALTGNAVHRTRSLCHSRRRLFSGVIGVGRLRGPDVSVDSRMGTPRRGQGMGTPRGGTFDFTRLRCDAGYGFLTARDGN